jgi:hypothetical protein
VCVLGGTGSCCRVYSVKRDCFYMWALARAISLYRRVTNSHVQSIVPALCMCYCCHLCTQRCCYMHRRDHACNSGDVHCQS